MNLKHLKRVFKYATAKSKIRPMLNCVNFSDGKATATDSYRLYQVQTTYSKQLEGKNLRPESNALKMDYIMDTVALDDVGAPVGAFLYDDSVYPKIDHIKPKFNTTLVKVNVEKLIDLLKCFNGEQVVISLSPNNPLSPMVIEAEGEYGLLMPIKIN